MKIIGHRGAAGLGPENTVKAIRAGIKAGADAVEFDIRLSKDNTFVLSHDAGLERTAGLDRKIHELTLESIRLIIPLDGEPIPTLEEALNARGDSTAVIEGKGGGWGKPLAEYMKLSSIKNACVISFNLNELSAFHIALPNIPCYALERQNAFKTILTAHRLGFTGVNLRFWILNPFSYWFAKLYRLDLIIYTVNRPFLMRWFSMMYPRVAVTTNRPDILSKIKKAN